MEDLRCNVYKCIIVEAAESMDILRVYSGLDGFHIRNIFILSSYQAHFTLWRQFLQYYHPAMFQVEDGAHIIDQFVSTVVIAEGLENLLVIYSPSRGPLQKLQV